MLRTYDRQELADATIADALDEARAAKTNDKDLDLLIWFKVVFDPVVKNGQYMSRVGSPIPRYTHSLDHAITLYKTLPDRIPNDPIRVVIEALEQHCA